jgi:hypothetical protein
MDFLAMVSVPNQAYTSEEHWERFLRQSIKPGLPALHSRWVGPPRWAAVNGIKQHWGTSYFKNCATTQNAARIMSTAMQNSLLSLDAVRLSTNLF